MGPGSRDDASFQLETEMPRATQRDILLVDDDSMTRSLLEVVLGGGGFRVRCAANASDALAAIKKAKPDLVLLDIGMPRMDGYELARELRARFGEGVPIVALTGMHESDPRRPADVRFDGWVEKPFDVGPLLSAIEGYLKPRPE
jgi:two-component system OmpR family response regulator